MREIGAIIDLSESRVCQIHSKIVVRLKNQLRSIRSELAS
jgi:DNA-directed RNA polymerase specialized sigma subunit